MDGYCSSSQSPEGVDDIQNRLFLHVLGWACSVRLRLALAVSSMIQPSGSMLRQHSDFDAMQRRLVCSS